MSKEARSPGRGAQWNCDRLQVHFDEAARDDEDIAEKGGTLPMMMTSTPRNANVLDSDELFFGVEDHVPDDPAFLSPSPISHAYRLLANEDITAEQSLDSGVVEANRADLETATESPSSSPLPDSVWNTDFHKKHMMAISSDKFDSLLKMNPHFLGCKNHMAAFVLVRELTDTPGRACKFYQAVALGTGRFSCTSWLCFNGTVVHDAQRALQRFLYKQLLLFFDTEPQAKEACIFKSSAAGPQLQLKPNTSLHLYTNQCPEGAAKNFYMCTPSMNGPGFSRRLCKGGLYSYFRQAAQLGGYGYLLDLSTYHSVKVKAGVNQIVKGLVKQHILSNHGGTWNAK